MTTAWRLRAFFFCPASVTAAVRDNLAGAFSTRSSLESLANERLMFNTASRFSLTGALPVQAVGWNTALRGHPADSSTMAGQLRVVIETLAANQRRFYIVANVAIPELDAVEGQLLRTDSPTAQIGSVFTWEDALAELASQRGLRLIETGSVP
jgi:hypothetical protein